MADAKLIDRARPRLLRIPAVVRETAERPLEDSVEDMVEALKRAAPVAPKVMAGRRPGELRDSIRKYRNPDRPLSWRVIASAKDAAGNLWGVFVEFGHGAAAPEPFWYPTYRAWKKIFRSRRFAEVRKALKTLFPD